MKRRGTAPFFYLRPEESILLQLKPEKEWALATFVSAAVVLTTLQALALFALTRLPGAPEWARSAVIGVYVALLVLVALVAWRRWATTEYALTDSRIYARTGRLRTRVHFTMHDRITDIRYHQGAVDRLFGISRISFMTAGGDVEVVGVRDAIAVKEATETARDAFLQRLLEKAGIDERSRMVARPASAPRAAPAADESPALPGAPLPPVPAPWTGPRPAYLKTGDTPLWYGKPKTVSAISAALPFVGIMVFVSLGAFGGGAGIFATPIVLLIATGAIVLRILQLKRMEYTVTDRRVYARSGILGTTVTQLTYDKITDITYRQDFLGRLFGYGGVTVNTAGSNQAPVTMIGLPTPLETQALIEAARGRYLREEQE